MYIIGSEAYLYDPLANQWTSQAIPSLSNPTSAMAVNGYVVVTGQSSTDTNQVDIYNPATGIWTSSYMPGPVGNFTAVTFGTKALYIAELGSQALASPSNILELDPATASWTESIRTANHDYLGASIVSGNQLILEESSAYTTPGQTVNLFMQTSVPGPANPTPADTATLTAPPASFSWSASPGEDGYDVYLDQAPVATVTSPMWMPTDPVLSGSHTWRIVAKFGGGTLTGPQWTFRVQAPA